VEGDSLTTKTHKPVAPTALLVKHLSEQLDRYEAELPKLPLRQRVVRLIDLQNSFRKLGKALLAEAGMATGSARGRIRQYLQAHKGEVIDGAELAVVGGISEYARRIRELRDEGLTILTGPDSDPSTGLALRPDQYVLAKKT
jgi:hypothetical protein